MSNIVKFPRRKPALKEIIRNSLHEESFASKVVSQQLDEQFVIAKWKLLVIAVANLAFIAISWGGVSLNTLQGWLGLISAAIVIFTYLSLFENARNIFKIRKSVDELL